MGPNSDDTYTVLVVPIRQGWQQINCCFSIGQHVQFQGGRDKYNASHLELFQYSFNGCYLLGVTIAEVHASGKNYIVMTYDDKIPFVMPQKCVGLLKVALSVISWLVRAPGSMLPGI